MHARRPDEKDKRDFIGIWTDVFITEKLTHMRGALCFFVSVAWVAVYLRPSQTSGQALMRSRSSEVGVGTGSREGSHGVNYQRWVQTYPCGKDSEENITLHMLSSPNWEFLSLINPRHNPPQHNPTPSNKNVCFPPRRSERKNTLTSRSFSS